MPPIRPRPWILLPIILMWSLGATSALAQSPGASPDASPSALDLLVEDVLAGALEDPAAIAAGEAAHRQGERAALGVAAIDPELPEIMDELDAIAAEVLGGYLAEPPFPTDPEATDGQRTPPGQGARGRSLAMLQAQVGLNLTWGMASAAAESFIGGWRPAPGTATIPGRPISTSGTFEQGGRFTSYTTTLNDALRVENGTIHLSYEFTMHSEVLDSASNATVAGIDDRGRVAISINPCPAAGGRVDTIVEAESDLTVRRPGGGSSSAREHATATAVTTVTDEAEIGQTVTDLATRRTISRIVVVGRGLHGPLRGRRWAHCDPDPGRRQRRRSAGGGPGCRRCSAGKCEPPGRRGAHRVARPVRGRHPGPGRT